MIDFIKSLNTKLDIQELLKNPLLEFESKFNVNTGEINESRKITEYQDITFEIVKDRYVNMFGSLHKYSNKGKHNYNDFTFSCLIDTIIDLQQNFNINPHSVPINNIEFAVNINTSFNPKSFIQRNIINFKGKQASISTFKGKGYLKEFITDRYIIKIYDKGLQFNRPENIFRFEVKVLKMEHLKNVGVKTLSDLLNYEVLNSLGNLLAETFDNLLTYDNSLNIDELTAKEQKIYQNGINPMFWENLKPDTNNYKHGSKNTQYKKDRKTYYRKLEQFKNLIQKYDLNRIQNDLSGQIKNKWNELLKIDSKKRDKLTDFLNEISGQKKGQINRLSEKLEKPKKGQINTSNIGLNCPLSVKECLITKLNISMQKKGSKFLNVSGIKYYQKNKPDIYLNLKKRLTKKQLEKSLKIQIKEIAHSVRNEYFNKKNNPRNNTKNSIKKLLLKPSLFNNIQLIDKRKLQVAGMCFNMK